MSWIPLPGRKPKYLSFLSSSGPQRCAERVDERRLVGDGALHHAIDLLVEIVVEARHVGGSGAHLGAIEQVAADEVERARRRRTRERR